MAYVKLEVVNHWQVIRFRTDRLTDPMTVAEVSGELERIVDPLPLRASVAIDFDGIEHISSQVIGLMLGLRDRVTKKHGTLVLCKLCSRVREVMRVTRLDRHFTFSESVTDVTGKRERSQKLNTEVTNWMD